MSFEIKNNDLIIWKDTKNRVFPKKKLPQMYLTGKCYLTGEHLNTRKILEILQILVGQEWVQKLLQLKLYKPFPANVLGKIETIGKKLGDGKYGTVWGYKDYAIKRIKVSTNSNGLVEKNALELLGATISRELKSPNIIGLYQYTRLDGNDYLVFEKVNGGTLWSFLQTSPNSLFVKGIIIQVLFTLLKCQESFPGFRHNDLKTDNILLDKAVRKEPMYLKWGNTVWKIPTNIPLVKIADFDYCNIPKHVKNNKVGTDYSSTFGCTKTANKIYDLHILLNSIYSQAIHLQPAMKKWLEKQLPKNSRGVDGKSVKYGRLCNPGKWNNIIPTPLEMLNDPFFKMFKIKYNSAKLKKAHIWGD